MSVLRILVFGSEGDLASSLADELKKALPSGGPHGLEFIWRSKVPPPSKTNVGAYHGALLVHQQGDPEQLKSWARWLTTQGTALRWAALVAAELPEVFSECPPSLVVNTGGNLDFLRQAFVPAETKADEAANAAATGFDLPEFAEFTDSKALPLEEIAPLPEAKIELAQAVDEFAGLDMGGEVPPTSEPVLESSEFKIEAPGGEGADVASSDWSTPLPESSPEAVGWGGSKSVLAGAPPTNSGIDADQLLVPASFEESASLADVEPAPQVFEAAASEMPEPEPHITSKMSRGVSHDESQTLQRYAALKEREAREKDAAIQALNRQIEQLRERMTKSESERRRITVAMTESEVLRRSLQDDRDQARHHITKGEAAHQEELRAMQLRLDNLQFQASRAEKKLEDFRERVRTDIQKIRMRERELANRLELQKRDAEALLAAKDERLLQQKREIDRLEFEVETLRERLVEQTQKAEDRVARVARSLRALKMASGMLSGIEDEVLPNADSKDDGEEAA